MPQLFNVNPENPQSRYIGRAAEMLREGAVIAFPTDSSYALGCRVGEKDALDRIRAIREVDDRHHMTLMCRDLSEIAKYARVDNSQYRLLKTVTPGCYVFLLEGTKELPRRVMHPKRKTIGLRIPDYPVILALLEELGEPLLTTTLQLPGVEEPLTEGWEIQDALSGRIELVLDTGHCGIGSTTVIDLTGSVPELVRKGLGPVAPFGIEDKG
ncbi:MAG: L-threonylcarbamoyladenylate synthase [Azovibrio sp.]